MRSFYCFTALLAWCVCQVWSTSDNLTSAVTWDQYSLLVNGSRWVPNRAPCVCELTTYVLN